VIHQKLQQLAWQFSSNESCQLPFEYLRVYSSQRTSKTVVAHKKSVRLINIDLVGKHGFRFTFDDQHSAIYSFDYLGELYRNYQAYWSEYLAQLQQAGQSREAMIDIKQL